MTNDKKESIIEVCNREKKHTIGGLIILKQFKEFVISLPDSIAEELERLAARRKEDASSFVAKLVRRECARESRLEEEMAEGYRQMAQINLELAEACLSADQETLNWYEEKLSECEQE